MMTVRNGSVNKSINLLYNINIIRLDALFRIRDLITRQIEVLVDITQWRKLLLCLCSSGLLQCNFSIPSRQIFTNENDEIFKNYNRIR